MGGFGALAAGRAYAQSRGRNVLFIVSDQFHHAAYGAAGNPTVKTPNLDRLAAGGARFSDSLAVTPFCSPTRASWLTGLYPHAHGITSNVRIPDRGVDDGFTTTEHDLQRRGYTCRQFGKWHLGDRSRLSPYRDQPAVLGGRPVNRTGGFDRKRARVEVIDAVERARAKAPTAANSEIGRIDTPPEESSESIVTNDAIQAIRELAGAPFMITVSLSAPHAPWQIGEPYYSMYPRDAIELPANGDAFEPADQQTAARVFGEALGEEGLREYTAIYYGMVSMVDWNVGRLLDALDDEGLTDRTLVIFTSDHGDMLGGHGMYGKTTFSMYEDTTRVPLLMRLPGEIPEGRVVETQSGSCDIRPTIVDYLGMEPPEPGHGVSLRPYIGGKEDLSRPMFAERERGRENFQRLIRTKGWKYVYSSDGRSQLYDLEGDPGETKNLVRDPAFEKVRAGLHARLRGWMEETRDPRALGG